MIPPHCLACKSSTDQTAGGRELSPGTWLCSECIAGMTPYQLADIETRTKELDLREYEVQLVEEFSDAIRSSIDQQPGEPWRESLKPDPEDDPENSLD